MKKKALFKDFIMEIKHTRNRFVSIMLIVALGVAFFSGIRASEPDMRLSADSYYDDSNLMDIRVLSTLGLTDKDIDYMKAIDGIDKVEGSYSLDGLLETKDAELVVKIQSITDDINKLNLLEGRMPESQDECVIDSHLLTTNHFKLGDTIEFISGSTDELQVAKRFTIVGIVNSAYYLSISRGNSSIGNGKISGYVSVLKDNFTLDAYTEIYATVLGGRALNSYDKEYETLVESIVTVIEEKKEIRIEERYHEVVDEPYKELNEGKLEYEKNEKEVYKDLDDAKLLIDEAKEEIKTGEEEIRNGFTELTKGYEELNSQETKLLDGKKQIEDGKKKIAESKELINAGKQSINEKKEEVKGNMQLLQEGFDEWQNGMDSYANGYKELLENENSFMITLKELNQKKEELEPYKSLYPNEWEQLLSNYNQVQLGLTEIEAKKIELDKINKTLKEKKVELDKNQAILNNGYETLLKEEENLKKKEDLIKEQEVELKIKEEEIEQGYESLRDGKKKLDESKQLLEEKEAELKAGKETLLEKEVEYKKGLKTAKEELQDAKDKLTEGEVELLTIKKPTWYVLDRNSIQTYVEFGQDAERIGNLGEVFPAIFFLVAALVSLTTMTRMIEEERTQIGTLKALGYSKKSIAMKYILYALLASLLGSIIGVLIGEKVIPFIVIKAYKILYNSIPNIIIPYNMYYAFLSTLIAVGTITITAFLSCYKELHLVPANLMRPQAPKLGKRVFLERVTFIWNRLNFTSKSTIRNLIRYKKRFFMTVFGIGGCMALLLVGFGIKDSVSAMSDIQYVKLWHQDAIISIDEEASEEEKGELNSYLDNHKEITNSLYVREISLDAKSDKSTKNVNLIVPMDVNRIDEFITLKNRITHETLTIPEDGVIITEKLASLLDVKVGERITILDGDYASQDVVVKGITENYMLHYIFMSNSLYKSLYEDTIHYNKVYIKTNNASLHFEELLASEVLEKDYCLSVLFTTEFQKTITNMLNSLNLVVYVLIISAGLLAFIVLYNLNNININERKRELATLKVLGFYDMEVSAYVYRENTLLTIIGTVLGIVLGIFLHRYVILTTEIDAIMFGRNIKVISFILSSILTFVFSLIVNYVMYFKLKKIDMVESLKSVE